MAYNWQIQSAWRIAGSGLLAGVIDVDSHVCSRAKRLRLPPVMEIGEQAEGWQRCPDEGAMRFRIGTVLAQPNVSVSQICTPPNEVPGEGEDMAAFFCYAAHKIVEANVQGIVADVSTGADSIPKASQAVRAAPANRPPMRFTWLPQADVNEPDTLVPRRGDGRPEDPRRCPQAEATGGQAPAMPSGWVGCAVAAHGSEP